jgi:hypothetical protein
MINTFYISTLMGFLLLFEAKDLFMSVLFSCCCYRHLGDDFFKILMLLLSFETLCLILCECFGNPEFTILSLYIIILVIHHHFFA